MSGMLGSWGRLGSRIRRCCEDDCRSPMLHPPETDDCSDMAMLRLDFLLSFSKLEFFFLTLERDLALKDSFNIVYSMILSSKTLFLTGSVFYKLIRAMLCRASISFLIELP